MCRASGEANIGLFEGASCADGYASVWAGTLLNKADGYIPWRSSSEAKDEYMLFKPSSRVVAPCYKEPWRYMIIVLMLVSGDEFLGKGLGFGVEIRRSRSWIRSRC